MSMHAYQAEAPDEWIRDYFGTFMSTSRDGLLVVDADGCFEFCNQGWCNITGRTQEQLIGQFFMTVVPEDMHDFMMERWREVSSGRGTPYETVILRPNGQRRSLLVSHLHMDVQGLRKYCVVCKDITERKAAEQELARYRDHLARLVADRTAQVEEARAEAQMIIDCAGDGILIVNPETGMLVDANPSMCQILQKRREELVGKPATDLLDAEELAARPVDWENLFNRSNSIDSRRLQRADGIMVEMEGHLSSLPSGLVMILARDVSERRRVERAVLDAVQDEERRIGAVLHDTLGQLLTGASYLCGSLEKSMEENAGNTGRAINNLRQVLQEAQTVTRQLARGLRPVEPVGESLPSLLEGLRSQLQLLFDVKVDLRVSPGFPDLDPEITAQLAQIAREAAFNAVRHGKPERIGLQLFQEGGMGRMEVEDDGIGFPSWIDLDRTLGVRLMQHRADTVGASLEISGRPGGGTRLRCRLPLEQPRA